MSIPIESRKPNTPAMSVIALLGPRALEIAARHSGEPTIAVFARTLPDKLERFQAAYQRVHALESEQAALLAERDLRMRVLRQATRGWFGHAAREIKDSGADTRGRTLDALFELAEDVINRLQQRDPTAPQTIEGRADLEPKLAAARAAYDTAWSGRVAVQEAQQVLRTCAAELHRELIKLRTALRVVLGAGHSDYQLLRATRTRTPAQPASGEGR